MATDKAKEVAEKAFHNMNRIQTAQAAEGFVKDGVVDKNILGNLLLMEAAVVALARWPETHPEDTLKGQYVYGLAARMDALKTIMPYCISKPEQAQVIRAESVEDYILRMAAEDGADDDTVTVEAITHEP